MTGCESIDPDQCIFIDANLCGESSSQGTLMLKNSLAACSMLLLALSVHAQTIPTQSASVESIRISIVRAIGAQNNTVEISIEKNIFTVSRVNSSMNESSHGGRNNEASAIASIVSKAITDRSEFKDILAIRVQYLSRAETRAKVIDTVEFRKDVNGVFHAHVT